MDNYIQIILIIIGFVVVATASNYLAKIIQKFNLPLITGFLFIGVLTGPYVLNFITPESINQLGFINDFSLAYIAFAAGSELYLKELRSRMKSIFWMTLGQFIITFIISALVIYNLAAFIPFMDNMSHYNKLAVSILMATIFVTCSPAVAIAIISELRAKGPFTQTALGVIVLVDVLVIVLFAANISISKSLITVSDFNLLFLILLVSELLAGVLIGICLGKLLILILSLKVNSNIKAALILFSGYNVYVLFQLIKEVSYQWLPVEVYIEPLLICITGSFMVTNYSKYKPEFLKIIHDIGPIVYVLFFTLVGATLNIGILGKVLLIAYILFFIRIISLIIGTLTGGALGGEPFKVNIISWMPFVAQAGISIGLATIVAKEFTLWGEEFSSLFFAVIIMNELMGPPLFKWAIKKAGEDYSRAESEDLVNQRKAIIFGLENQALALAKQLNLHGWDVKIITYNQNIDEFESKEFQIVKIPDISLESLKIINTKNSSAIVALLSDSENYQICQLVYENFGTKEVVVRLNERENFEKFHKLGCLIVEPATAIVSLLDHFVRSPQATSLLLGMAENQDTADLEIQNPNLHGLALRDLRLPSDIIILSVKRSDHNLISHGYTRLRLGDMVTLVGSVESIASVALKFEKQ